MNTFDWVKINTSFQFYSKETLKGMARYQYYKVVHLEKSFSFFLLLSPPECACRFCPRIYIYIIESKYDTARRGVESGKMRGRSDGLFLREINAGFPQEHIYI